MNGQCYGTLLISAGSNSQLLAVEFLIYEFLPVLYILMRLDGA
jgi:hypothetical protein